MRKVLKCAKTPPENPAKVESSPSGGGFISAKDFLVNKSQAENACDAKMAGVQANYKKVSPKNVEVKTKENYPNNIEIGTKTKPNARRSEISRSFEKASNSLKNKNVPPKIAQTESIENVPSTSEIVTKSKPKEDVSENMNEEVRKPVKHEKLSPKKIITTTKVDAPIQTNAVNKAKPERALNKNNRDVKSTSNTSEDKKTSKTNIRETKDIELSTIKKAKSDEDLRDKKTSPKIINVEAQGDDLNENNKIVAMSGTGVDMSEHDPACELSKECSK